MKAAVYQGTGSIAVRELDLPEPQPGWLRVAVTAAGISGTDLHIYPAALGDPSGMQPGHEIAGLIHEAGDGTRIRPGTHVAVEPVSGLRISRKKRRSAGGASVDRCFLTKEAP